MYSGNKGNYNEPLSPSQESHALQPKDQPNECHKVKVSYFNPDIHSKIVERAKKENLLQQAAIPQVSAKKGKGEQSERGKVDHLGKASKIVEDLIKKHGMAKEKISKMREEAAKQADKECSFRPPAVVGGQKFVFRGNIIERNQIWLEEKKRKEIERKEEALVNDLQQCTFSPEISSRKMSQIYLKNKSKLNHDHSHQRQHKTPTPNVPLSPSPLRNKKDISLTQFQSAKKQIKSRLFTIALRN